MAHHVQLYKYDLSNGLARQLSLGMLGIHLEAIWHTSIVVYGREFFFDGGVGIANGAPGHTRFGSPLEVVDMGRTDVEPTDFAAWAREMNATYGPTDYNLMNRNCNHFSSDALEFLVGRRVSEDVASMIDRVMATPFGQMLRPSLEAMTTAPPTSPSNPAAPVVLLSHGASVPRVETAVTRAVEAASAGDDPRAALKALGVVQCVIRNCLDQRDAKYGQVNVAGTAFAPVRAVPAAMDALRAVGFGPSPSDADRWVLPPASQSRGSFTYAITIVDSAIESLEQLVAALDASVAGDAAA